MRSTTDTTVRGPLSREADASAGPLLGVGDSCPEQRSVVGPGHLCYDPAAYSTGGAI